MSNEIVTLQNACCSHEIFDKRNRGRYLENMHYYAKNIQLSLIKA